VKIPPCQAPVLALPPLLSAIPVPAQPQVQAEDKVVRAQSFHSNSAYCIIAPPLNRQTKDFCKMEVRHTLKRKNWSFYFFSFQTVLNSCEASNYLIIKEN
jgi:hypothetical protein